MSAELPARLPRPPALAVAKGRAKYPGGGHLPVCCGASQLPFADDEFNIVVSTHTLVHLAEMAQFKAALGELARVLKPGGDLILGMTDRPAKTKAIDAAIEGQFARISRTHYRRSLVSWWERKIVIRAMRGKKPILSAFLSAVGPLIYAADVFGPTTYTLYICEDRKSGAA